MEIRYFFVANLILGFILCIFLIPKWIRVAKENNLVGKDIQKLDKREVAEAGGIIVLLVFILMTLIYISLKVYTEKINYNNSLILAVISCILISGFIGFTDDILGWKKGLGKITRIILMYSASLPLIVINAGNSNMMGINFGLFYPLFFIPLGIIGATTTFNFLAGYNGLETSQGIVLVGALSIVNYLTGTFWLAYIGLLMVVCLSAFYIYNKFPAKVFPGDVLTYSVGVMIAIQAILGNIEKIAVFFFIPYILEVILKVRGKLVKQSFARVKKDGSLENQYDKIYGVEHLAVRILGKIKEKVYEKEVVYLINFFQILIIILGFILFI